MVPGFRKGIIRIADLPEPAVNGLTQESDLGAGIVDVELSYHVIPTKGKDPTKGVAQGGAPAVSQMEGTGGVGADKFNQDLFSTASIIAAIFALQVPHHG